MAESTYINIAASVRHGNLLFLISEAATPKMSRAEIFKAAIDAGERKRGQWLEISRFANNITVSEGAYKLSAFQAYVNSDDVRRFNELAPVMAQELRDAGVVQRLHKKEELRLLLAAYLLDLEAQKTEAASTESKSPISLPGLMADLTELMLVEPDAPAIAEIHDILERAKQERAVLRGEACVPLPADNAAHRSNSDEGQKAQ